MCGLEVQQYERSFGDVFEEVVAIAEPMFAQAELERLMAGATPFREDESFDLADLADEEQSAFVQAFRD